MAKMVEENDKRVANKEVLLDIEVQDTNTALVTWNIEPSSASRQYEGLELIFSPRKTHLGCT